MKGTSRYGSMVLWLALQPGLEDCRIHCDDKSGGLQHLIATQKYARRSSNRLSTI